MSNMINFYCASMGSCEEEKKGWNGDGGRERERFAGEEDPCWRWVRRRGDWLEMEEIEMEMPGVGLSVFTERVYVRYIEGHREWRGEGGIW